MAVTNNNNESVLKYFIKSMSKDIFDGEFFIFADVW